MKTLTRWSTLLAMTAAGFLAGCSSSSKSPDLSQNLRNALDQAGLKKVSVSQDREKGVVTLGGPRRVGQRKGSGRVHCVVRGERTGSVGPDRGAPSRR